MNMVACECGATLAPSVIIRDDVGDRHRCPECRRFWECCPACFGWFRPFCADPGHPDANHCDVDDDHKTALRLPNDSPRGRTLKSLRQDPAVTAWEPLEGDTETSVDYPEDGDPVAAGGVE